MLPKVHGNFKTNCLEIVQNGVDSIDGVFTEMKTKGIINILSHRDEASQHVALKVVHAMLRHLKPEELLYLLPTVAGFSSNSSTLCRGVMYEIFMWIYDNYRSAFNYWSYIYHFNSCPIAVQVVSMSRTTV